MTPAYCKPEPNHLTVTFERDGEEPETVTVAGGRRAAVAAVGLIIKRRILRADDRVTVTAATD